MLKYHIAGTVCEQKLGDFNFMDTDCKLCIHSIVVRIWETLGIEIVAYIMLKYHTVCEQKLGDFNFMDTDCKLRIHSIVVRN